MLAIGHGKYSRGSISRIAILRTLAINLILNFVINQLSAKLDPLKLILTTPPVVLKPFTKAVMIPRFSLGAISAI